MTHRFRQPVSREFCAVESRTSDFFSFFSCAEETMSAVFKEEIVSFSREEKFFFPRKRSGL